MLELKNIYKSFEIRKGKTQTVLNDFNVTLSNSGFVSILGNSGNGKTTLLNIIGGLDQPDSGEILFNNEVIKDYEKFRRERVGYVFQEFNLVGHLNAIDNVILSMSNDVKNKKSRAIEILKDLGLEEHLHKHPSQLSGGQQQRVAIGRMIAKDVDVIICDEPTGSLDEVTEKRIVDLVKELSKTKLVIFVTHNRRLAEEYSDRIIYIRNGQVSKDTNGHDEVEMNKNVSSKSFSNNILWLAVKNLLGRYKYTLKYLGLISFIFIVAAFSIVLEGEFFKQYLHEDLIGEGIKIIFVETEEEDYNFEELKELDNVEHIEYHTWRYSVSMAASDVEQTRRDTELLFENITDNEFIKNQIVIGRAPESPDEIVMTAEGAMSLLTSLLYDGERLMDQYESGEMSIEYVFDLIDDRIFIMQEYGNPRVQIVGLIPDDRLFEFRGTAYYVDGFFDLFTYPYGPHYNMFKIYKSDKYREPHNVLKDQINEIEGLQVMEYVDNEAMAIYDRIDSSLALSKMSLYVVVVIASVSFVSVLLTSFFERNYEIGLYRSIGYNKRSIRRILGFEMFITGLVGLVISTVFLLLFSLYMYMNYDYLTSYMDVLTTLNVGTILAVLFGVVTILVLAVVYSGNQMVLRKSVLSNIKDL